MEKSKIHYTHFGLGDLVDLFTTYSGLKWVIMKLNKGKCGCAERKRKWNQFFSLRFGKSVLITHKAETQKPKVPCPTCGKKSAQ